VPLQLYIQVKKRLGGFVNRSGSIGCEASLASGANQTLIPQMSSS
jgi:hypothetical protein